MHSKRFIAMLTLVFFLNAYPANAVIPLIAAGEAPAVAAAAAPLLTKAYLLASLLLHAGVAGTIAYIQRNGTGSGTTTADDGTTGKIATGSTVVWVDLTGPNGTPKVNSYDIVATVDLATLNSVVASRPSYFQALPSTTYSLSRPTNDGSIHTAWRGYPYNDTINVQITGFYRKTTGGVITTHPITYGAGKMTLLTWEGVMKDANGVSYPRPSANDYDTSYEYYAVASSLPVSPDVKTANTPSQQASAINSSSSAKNEVAKAISLIDSSKVQYSATPTPATVEQLRTADNSEYRAQQQSLNQSAAAAQSVAAANPTPQNQADAASWQAAADKLNQGGSSAMAPGYPITSGSGSFPSYNGTASSPSTTSPPTIGTSNGSNAPGTGSSVGGSDQAYINATNAWQQHYMNGNPKGMDAQDQWNQAARDAYGPSDSFNIGKRFSTFIDDMKKTPFFSLTGSFLGDIPTGGSSTMTFTAGRFGTHTYDFATWGSLLNTLKVIILIIFSAFGFKIVVGYSK